ncbi:MAG: septum formation protein Maf [Ignavibacteria bacterium]|nr:septum formation protein Maf [Ignavibacteria bacterium]
MLRKNYVLASVSPRRIQLLEMLGLNFISIGSGVEEIDSASNPVLTVKRNALAKSREVAFKFQKEIVIGADTIVVLGKNTLNKPANLKQAREYLRRLSGNKHIVYTGVNVINTKNGNEVFGYEKTVVQFRDLTDDEINFYVNKFKPLDKAGAYGIQDDFGCLFISRIVGDYYNIVGLPLVKLYECIKAVA